MFNLVTILIALLAVALSSYTLWDNNFNVKLDCAVGRQIRLDIARVAANELRLGIFMSFALSNYGGKIGYLNDIKIRAKLISDGTIKLEKDFIALREYNTLLGSPDQIKQAEILPIVMLGKTTTPKKYIFVLWDSILQDQIPKKFDLHLQVFIKKGDKWEALKNYEAKDISGVWQDLNSVTHNFSIRDIHELQ